MTPIRAIFLAPLILFSVLIPNTSQALIVRAELDRTPIFLDESVNLTITAEGKTQVTDGPDLTPLRKDFEILGTSIQTRIKIVNGERQIAQHWVVEIKPKRAGITEVPVINVGDKKTSPIQLKVNEFTGNYLQEGADIFIETELTPANPYVQSQAILTIRLFVAVSVPEGTLSKPVIPFGVIEEIGQDRNFVAKRAGRNYRTVERRYAIFPENSGTVEIAPIEFNCIVARYNQSTLQTEYSRERITSNAIPVKVRPKPRGYSGATWLPARELTLEDSWSGVAPEFEPGKPESRIITMRAVGLRPVQLPALSYDENDSVRVYSNNPQTSTGYDIDWVTGEREEEFVVIPQKDGQVEVPEFWVVWWDVEEDREKIATLPAVFAATNKAGSINEPMAQKFEDKGASLGSVTDLELVSKPEGQFWKFASIAMFVLWIGTAVFWLLIQRARRRYQAQQLSVVTNSELEVHQAIGIVKRECQQGNHVNVSRALLDWAKLTWPDRPPRNLIELGSRLGSEELLTELETLDRNIYSDANESWSGERLWILFSKVKASSARSTRYTRGFRLFRKSREPLQELWPEHGSTT